MSGTLRASHDSADARHVQHPGLRQHRHRHAEPRCLAGERIDRRTDLGRPVPVIDLGLHREPRPGGRGIGNTPAAKHTAGQNGVRDVAKAVGPAHLEDSCLASLCRPTLASQNRRMLSGLRAGGRGLTLMPELALGRPGRPPVGSLIMTT